MNSVLQQIQQRREFLRGLARYTLLGTALVLARVLSARPPGDPAKCFKVGVCQGCAALRSCSQPQADTARKQAS